MTQPPTPPCFTAPAPTPPVDIHWHVDPTLEPRPSSGGIINVVGQACIDCGHAFVRSHHVLPNGDGVYLLRNTLTDRRCPSCDLTRQLVADLAAYNELPFWRRMITRRPGRDR